MKMRNDERHEWYKGYKRLQKIDLPSLEYRGRRGTMIEMFKIGYNRYDPKATKGIFELNNHDTRTNDKKVIKKKANLEVRKNVLPLDQLQICDIRPEWTKMQVQHIRVFNSEPSELAVLKE